MKKFLTSAAALLLSVFVSAATLEKISVRSEAMNKDVNVIVVAPDEAKAAEGTRFPVVYLLHGYSGNEDTWVQVKPELPALADLYGIIFVCPDGQNSWYFDSPIDPKVRYETFVSNELIGFVDRNYRTIASREGRAVTGLSMGGHGAMWLSLRHKDVFGAAGTTSGGVDIRPFPENWEIKRVIGELSSDGRSWDDYTVVNLVDGLENGELALIVDCGYDDFFFDVNLDLHERLRAKGIDHDYLVRPGVHNGPYWTNSIDYQILFFKKYFDRVAGKQ